MEYCGRSGGRSSVVATPTGGAVDAFMGLSFVVTAGAGDPPCLSLEGEGAMVRPRGRNAAAHAPGGTVRRTSSSRRLRSVARQCGNGEPVGGRQARKNRRT